MLFVGREIVLLHSVTHTYNPSTWEVGQKGQGHKVSLGYNRVQASLGFGSPGLREGRRGVKLTPWGSYEPKCGVCVWFRGPCHLLVLRTWHEAKHLPVATPSTPLAKCGSTIPDVSGSMILYVFKL